MMKGASFKLNLHPNAYFDGNPYKTDKRKCGEYNEYYMLYSPSSGEGHFSATILLDFATNVLFLPLSIMAANFKKQFCASENELSI